METGFKYRLQCLPRTLTLYCEFGSEQMARTSRQQTVKERSAATKVWVWVAISVWVCEFGSEQMARTSRQQTVKERPAATKLWVWV